jgi:hypothetical protein
MTYPGLLMCDGSSKIHYFMNFSFGSSIKKIKTDELGINGPIS